MNNRILLVEDDSSICEMVRDYLDSEGFQVEIFADGNRAVKAFSGDPGYALALIDLMLPGMGGMEVIRAIRRISTVPVIVITARDSDTDKSMGLNLGADDYVVKPFSLIELTARIRANIRRVARYDSPPEENKPPYGFGQQGSAEMENLIRIRDLEIDVSKHTAALSGVQLELTPTEFDILCLLASHPGQAFSKERLYGLVWKEPYFGNESVLNTHINRLRSKLKEASGSGETYIKTLWGIGYKMESE